MSKKIKLALVGKGAWGKNYIRTIAGLPDCELPPQYIKSTDYKDLFRYRDIDGVIIATPPLAHFTIASEFLRRGYNILVEKPLTTNYKDALWLRKIASQSAAVAMVGHIYRYHPAFLVLQKMIPTIGKVRYIQSIGVDWGPIRSDVSAFWDWAPHDISMCLAILGVQPLSVAAWGIRALRPRTSLYDMASINLVFPKNITAFVTVGWLSPVKKRSLTVVGERGSLIFDDIAKEKVTYIEGLGEDRRVTYPTYSRALPLTLEVLEFINCIKNKRQPKTDLKEGILTVKIIEAAEKSIREGGKIVKMV